MCRFLQPLHEFSSGKDRAVISAFLRSSDRHNVSYTLSKEFLQMGHDIVFDLIGVFG